jgi:hypothetical protein
MNLALRQMIIDITNLEELKEALELMNRKRDQLLAKKTLEFSVGDSVAFESKKLRRDIKGTVVKINQVSISLDCGADGKWNVSPSFCKKVTA